MDEDRYPVTIDERTGRARVEITGQLSAKKILHTFAAVSLDKRWAGGDRSVLWDARAASFPASFEFKDIFQATGISRALTRPGKSAIVVPRNADMLRKAARFYQGIAVTSTGRHIEVFFGEREATAWLDQTPS